MSEKEGQGKLKVIPSYQFWAVVLIISGLVISGIYVYLLLNTFNIKSEPDIAKFGAFGDFIGGVIGSLWALAGVFLFFQALKDQRKDTEINIEQLQLQIKGLEESKLTAEEQNKLLQIQRFENTFFSLLKFFIETTDSLEIPNIKSAGANAEKIVKGKKVLIVIADKLNFYTKKDQSKHFLVMHTNALTAYEKTHSEYEEILQPYFGVLHSLLTFIDNADLSISEKYTYSNTLRSYLTNSELLILNYHWSRNIREDFKNLFKKFNLLKNLPISIRPEFKLYKEQLDRILANSNEIYPPDLFLISETIVNLIRQEYFERKRSFHQLFTSCLAIWVQIEGFELEVQIKVPTSEWRKELLDVVEHSDADERILEELRKFDFCSLIQCIVFANMVYNNFHKLLSPENKLIYTVEEKVYDTQDVDYKVFKCTFTFKRLEDMFPPVDWNKILAVLPPDKLEEIENLV
ncbi:MAG TPA: putative phage abortive infection protein [Pyrinomonadaceae bacterium]|jgi:hypothetical protein|nr:putative phage abortive infection protein [Pyrinomonadaceae bacterium]